MSYSPAVFRITSLDAIGLLGKKFKDCKKIGCDVYDMDVFVAVFLITQKNSDILKQGRTFGGHLILALSVYNF